MLGVMCPTAQFVVVLGSSYASGPSSGGTEVGQTVYADLAYRTSTICRGYSQIYARSRILNLIQLYRLN